MQALALLRRGVCAQATPTGAALSRLASLVQGCEQRQWASSSGRDQVVDQTHQAQVRRLLYRSKQRGWLELDLLVGMWAEKELPRMAPQLLTHFEVLLDEENPELFKWLTGQLQAPQPMQQNEAFQLLRQHVAGMLKESARVETPQGKTWVRGWDDWKKEGPAPGPMVDAAAAAGGSSSSSAGGTV